MTTRGGTAGSLDAIAFAGDTDGVGTGAAGGFAAGVPFVDEVVGGIGIDGAGAGAADAIGGAERAFGGAVY